MCKESQLSAKDVSLNKDCVECVHVCMSVVPDKKMVKIKYAVF